MAPDHGDLGLDIAHADGFTKATEYRRGQNGPHVCPPWYNTSRPRESASFWPRQSRSSHICCGCQWPPASRPWAHGTLSDNATKRGRSTQAGFAITASSCAKGTVRIFPCAPVLRPLRDQLHAVFLARLLKQIEQGGFASRSVVQLPSPGVSGIATPDGTHGHHPQLYVSHGQPGEPLVAEHRFGNQASLNDFFQQRPSDFGPCNGKDTPLRGHIMNIPDIAGTLALTAMALRRKSLSSRRSMPPQTQEVFILPPDSRWYISVRVVPLRVSRIGPGESAPTDGSLLQVENQLKKFRRPGPLTRCLGKAVASNKPHSLRDRLGFPLPHVPTNHRAGTTGLGVIVKAMGAK